MGIFSRRPLGDKQAKTKSGSEAKPKPRDHVRRARLEQFLVVIRQWARFELDGLGYERLRNVGMTTGVADRAVNDAVEAGLVVLVLNGEDIVVQLAKQGGQG
jgi:hypothetical protein